MRAEIENIVKEHDISSADFKALDIHEEWHQIEENIYHTFCQLNHPIVRPLWLWEYFKLETSSLVVVKAIRKVILESCYIDELYLASKKYDWLICINHHDVLIATGKIIAEKLRNLSDIEP